MALWESLALVAVCERYVRYGEGVDERSFRIADGRLRVGLRALLITHQTNGIHFTALDPQHLKRARYQDTDQTIPEKVKAA